MSAVDHLREAAELAAPAHRDAEVAAGVAQLRALMAECPGAQLALFVVGPPTPERLPVSARIGELAAHDWVVLAASALRLGAADQRCHCPTCAEHRTALRTALHVLVTMTHTRGSPHGG